MLGRRSISFSHLALWAAIWNTLQVSADVTLRTIAGDPETLSDQCISVLTAPINCDASLEWADDINLFYRSSTLDALCTATCTSALRAWFTRTKAACGTSRYQGYDGYSYLALYGVQAVLERYDSLCLKNSCVSWSFFKPSTPPQSSSVLLRD